MWWMRKKWAERASRWLEAMKKHGLITEEEYQERKRRLSGAPRFTSEEELIEYLVRREKERRM